MLRKIFAIVLTITAVVVLFTACDGNGDDTTTQEPLSTSDTSTTESTTEPTTTTQASTGPTFILTTNQHKQAPWYSTTRFVPTPGTQTTTTQSVPSTSMTNAYDNITYPTSNVTTPSVSAVTSAAKTTVWSTIPSDTTTTTTTKESTTAATTTEAVEAEGMQAVINSTWFDGDGNFCAAIDKEGWGKIKSNSMRIPVYIDGVEADKPATLQISSSVDGDGCQYVFVNLSKYDVLEFGTSVSFTIPEGFLKNASGTRYNYATEVSM